MSTRESQEKSAPSLEAIAHRLDALQEQIVYLVQRQRRTEELFSDMTPILRDMLAKATERFDELEKDGAVAFAKELAVVTRKIVQGYSPEDVRQLGDSVVKILDTVRALTQPEVLAIASEAGAVLAQADQAEPIGIVGMVRASRDDDVQKGMAVMMEVLRHVGRGAKALAEQRQAASSAEDRKARLAKKLGPTRKRALGVERPSAALREQMRAEAKDLGPPVVCATPAPRAEEAQAATVLDGVAFNKDGHLVDPKQWTRDLAVTIAEAQGTPLDPARWKVIEFARADFEEHGVAPNVRRITMGTGLATKDLYTMFPKAPARTVAKIAGIPKPAGCI